MPTPPLDDLLRAAVQAVGGSQRPGQERMAHAVEQAIANREHLLVQAGTGTGKSLAYLVPLLAHAHASGKPAVVATATLALQAQIVDRDLPLLADALAPLLGRPPSYGLVKGRANYLCRHKLDGGYPDEAPALFGTDEAGAQGRAASRIGEQVVRLRQWASQTQSGDRDELVPGVLDAAWRQVSVSARECLGSKCPQVQECFVELARARAREVDIVVTNHAFMAIDACEDRTLLPEHEVLVVDEAHELVDRITSTITDELSPATVRAAAKRAGTGAEAVPVLEDTAQALELVLDNTAEGRFTAGLPDALLVVLAACRDAARRVLTELKSGTSEQDAARKVARSAVEEVHQVCERLLEQRALDVCWRSESPTRGAALRVAPMSVAMLVRDKVMAERTVILTSATLELGGSFAALAGSLGLAGEQAPAWSSADVGSPFDYSQQAIAYVPMHLPPPGRDGLSVAALDEIEALLRAAGGRTLGLFSSMRAAQQATEEMRERFTGKQKAGITVRCQGEEQLSTLVREFARDAKMCLFGTLSLWQGVDVPGSSCQLVIIDRIPFPRPDDPLSSARTQEIARRGGNGFMAVSATHAALRLAQGAGRLVRRAEDRGVVAILDTRMRSAGYASFLQRSLPPFWPTTDRELVLQALARLDSGAPPVVPVEQPQARSAAGAEPAVAVAADQAIVAPPAATDTPRSAVTAGQGWTLQEDEELRDGVEMGLSTPELAEHLEKSAEAVKARVEQLELATPVLFEQ